MINGYPAGRKGVPCCGGEPALTDAQMDEWVPFVPGWQVNEGS